MIWRAISLSLLAGVLIALWAVAPESTSCPSEPAYALIANAGQSVTATKAWYTTAPGGLFEPGWWSRFGEVNPQGYARQALYVLWARGLANLLAFVGIFLLFLLWVSYLLPGARGRRYGGRLFTATLVVLATATIALGYSISEDPVMALRPTVMRSLPGPQGALESHIAAGTLLAAHNRRGAYVRVTHDDASGWMPVADLAHLMRRDKNCP